VATVVDGEYGAWLLQQTESLGHDYCSRWRVWGVATVVDGEFRGVATVADGEFGEWLL